MKLRIHAQRKSLIELMNLKQNWQQLMEFHGWPENHKTRDKLLAAYGARSRHYHNQQHLSACLLLVDQYRSEINEPQALQLAFWFHDAIYNFFSSKNELRSAAWAKDFALAQGADINIAHLLHSFILDTIHGRSDVVADNAWMVDIDLAILGVSADIYEQYSKAVRKEYRLIPQSVYSKGRKKVLGDFLALPNIYNTPAFRASHEAQARENIQRELAGYN